MALLILQFHHISPNIKAYLVIHYTFCGGQGLMHVAEPSLGWPRLGKTKFSLALPSQAWPSLA